MNQVNLVSKCFVVNSEQQILIIRRSPALMIRPGMWDIPGGLVDLNEDPNTAVVREIHEETGLTLEQPHILHIATELKPAYILTFFYATAYPEHADKTAITISNEHTEYAWVGLDEFKKLELPAKFYRAANLLGIQ